MSAGPTVVTLGPSGIDRYFETDVWPELGGKAMLHAPTLTYGGMIANTACVLASLGVRTRHVERIGADAAEGVLGAFRDAGVDTSLVQVSHTARSCTCYVVRVGGERAILIDDTGREPLVVDDAMRTALREASVIVTSLAELRAADVRDAVFAATAVGARLTLDVEPAGIADLELDVESMRRAAWVCISPDALDALGLTAAELAGGNSASSGSSGSGAQDAGREVVVTRGSRGSTVHAGDRVVELPAIRVAAVDTTGCSDTYLATYVAARLRDDDVELAGRLATAAAARAATIVGPRAGMASMATVEAFLRENARDTPGAPVARDGGRR
jgi:ribokinase